MQGKPVDIRLTNTSIADRQRFMQLLVKHGIKGIGAYFPVQKMVDTLFMQTLVEKTMGVHLVLDVVVMDGNNQFLNHLVILYK